MRRTLPGGASAWSTIGLDVGGTKILAGILDQDGTLAELRAAETPGRQNLPRAVEDAMVRVVGELRAGREVRAVGVGAAGFVGREGTVRFAPHVSWRDEPLQRRLEERLGLPVVVDNDANVTALAELELGAARGARDAVCITLGTGIGGAVVMDGDVRRGTSGLAGEFGHMQVVPQGRPCPCGQNGCWEQYCSGTALRRAAREHGAPAGTEGPDVTAAAGAGVDWALRAFEDVGGWLGVGAAALCSALDPEVVVVGGGLSGAGELLLDPARAALAEKLPGREHRPMPRLVQAACGPQAGMIGAALLARASIDP
ncbi:MAG TPA: ROK family protein [Nocardioides sp.]|uniref:ROK family protein n=1 Tax=Nocardioides sp. TaxID=35761 RepID=UPI002D7E7E6E|nr:ROK family protein [Nocardioides sp.]HET6651212.1 ROK family protein [Nocardioides sp.]